MSEILEEFLITVKNLKFLKTPRRFKMKAKSIRLSAGRPVAILHEKKAKELNLHVDERVIIKCKNKMAVAIIDTARGGFNKEEIIISEELLERLGIHACGHIDILPMEELKSSRYIREKIKGLPLTEEKIYEIIKDIVDNKLTEAEIAYFVSAVYINRMSLEETTYLIKSIVKTGKRLELRNKVIADKHSIGGVAGNRTTPIVVSICAAAGLTMPKTSSRAITSAAGTADVIECITNVEFSVGEIKRIISKVGACLVWGGALGLAPADDKIIQVERLLYLDPEAQLLASIISKKISVGATHLVIDIPCGKSAKFSPEEGRELAKKFNYLCSKFKIKCRTVITRGSEPIGNGIGPILEILDVISVLNRDENRPLDLEDKSLNLAAALLELTGKAKRGQGFRLAYKILDSGMALNKFEEIVKAQNGSAESKRLDIGRYKKEILSPKTGAIKEINNKKINSIARILGCPADKGAGMYIRKHCQNSVKKNEGIAVLYAENEEKLNYGLRLFNELKPIKVV